MSKTVFITGASSGMGKTTAGYLTRKGYKVYGTSRNPAKHSGLSFPLVKMDLTDPGSIQRAVATVLEKEGKIDVLINNAGRGMIGPVEESGEEEIKEIFDTNVFGLIRVSKEVLKDMHRRNEGLIINISSIAGFAGLPYRGLYSATKSAAMTVSETMRFELHGSGIKVVDVAPGDFKTDITKGRIYVANRKGSPYYEKYEEVLKTIDQAVDAGFEPLKMAKLIEKIIRTKNPKMQYKIGPFDQKLLPLIKTLLPQRWFENLILKLYHLK